MVYLSEFLMSFVCFSQTYPQHDQRYGYQDYRQSYGSDYAQVPDQSSSYTAGTYDRSYGNYGESYDALKKNFH